MPAAEGAVIARVDGAVPAGQREEGLSVAGQERGVSRLAEGSQPGASRLCRLNTGGGERPKAKLPIRCRSDSLQRAADHKVRPSPIRSALSVVVPLGCLLRWAGCAVAARTSKCISGSRV